MRLLLNVTNAPGSIPCVVTVLAKNITLPVAANEPDADVANVKFAAVAAGYVPAAGPLGITTGPVIGLPYTPVTVFNIS